MKCKECLYMHDLRADHRGRMCGTCYRHGREVSGDDSCAEWESDDGATEGQESEVRG